VERLTVLATVFLPLTSVTGFFGQNFGLRRRPRPPHGRADHGGRAAAQRQARPVIAGMSRHDAVMLEFARWREE